MMPSTQLSEIFDSMPDCSDTDACRTQFLQAALGSGILTIQDLNDATAALAGLALPATFEFNIEANCSTSSPIILTFSEPVLSVDGQPFSAADLRITVDSAAIENAVLTPLATPATYSLRLSREFLGYEKLVVRVPADRLVGARFGVVPAHTGSLLLPDCVPPAMEAAVVGSDQLPAESAPTDSDGLPLELNTLFLTFSEPVVGSTPDGVLGSDFMIEIADPVVNSSYTVVAAEAVALAYGGKTRRLQQAAAVERVALKLMLPAAPLGGEVVRITPISIRDEAGNAILPVAYAVLGALSNPFPEGPGAQAGITTGNAFKCTTLEAGQLIVASLVLAHAMLYGAGVLLPYVARAEHVAQYGSAPPKQRFAPRWGPAAWAVTLILCVSLLPTVALGHVHGMTYTIALLPLWAMLLALFVKGGRALHRIEAPFRSKMREILPTVLPLLYLALGALVTAMLDYPDTFSTAGVRTAATLPLAIGIAAVSIRLLLKRGSSPSPKEAERREHIYRRALARQSVGLLLLAIIVTLSAIRLEWDQECQQSWAWALLPLLCAVGLLLIQQLLQRLLPRCFAPPEPLQASHGIFRQELPAELEPKAGDAQLMLQKVMDRALAEGRSLTEVANEMLNQEGTPFAPELPPMVLTAVQKEFEQRHGRPPADEAEALAFLKRVVSEAHRARVEQSELELITVPEDVLDQAHEVLFNSGLALTAGETSDVRALQALSDKLALDVADFESRTAADANATRETLELKRSVDAYIRAQTRVAELEAVAALPEAVISVLEAAFGDTDKLDCEQVFGADAVVPANIVMAAEMEYERREGRDPTDEAEAISFLKGVVQGAQQARVEQKELELIALPDKAVEMARLLLEESGDTPGSGEASNMLAFQALSDKLALDVSEFESYAAQADTTRESLVLKRTVDTYLDAQKRVAELEKAALPEGIASAVKAEFAQPADGGADHHDPLELLDLCAQVVDEPVGQPAARSPMVFTTKNNSSSLDDISTFECEFETERMNLEHMSAHGFDMIEENEDGTLEKLSIRRIADDDQLLAPNGGQRSRAVKQASEADKPRVPAAYSTARAPPVLNKCASPVLMLNKHASGVMSVESKAQVMAAVAHMEEANKAAEIGTLNEAWAPPAATPAPGQRKSNLVPAAALATGLVVTVTAGVLAGALGSGTAAPSAGTAIGISLGAAAVIAAALIAYRIKRHYRNKKVQMLSHQLRKTSRVTLAKEKSSARSGFRSLTVTPTAKGSSSVVRPPSSGRKASSGDSIGNNRYSERSDSASLSDLERLQARVNRVTESNNAPLEPSFSSSHARLPPLTSHPSSLQALSHTCSLDRAVLPDTLASRLSLAKNGNGKMYKQPSPTQVGASPGNTSPVPQHRLPPILGNVGQTISMKHRTAPVAHIPRPGTLKKLSPDELQQSVEHRATRAPPTLDQAQPAGDCADPAR